MASISKTPRYEDEAIIVEEDEHNRICPTRLYVAWGNDKRYWQLYDCIDRPSAILELKQVCWLEVAGEVRLGAGKKYEIGFRALLKSDAFGWGGTPLYLMAKFGRKGKYKKKQINLHDEQREKELNIPTDGFIVEAPPTLENTILYFGLYEVWSGKWKGGLQIHYTFVKEVTR